MIVVLFMIFLSCQSNSIPTATDSFELSESRPFDPKKEKQDVGSVQNIIIKAEGSLVKILSHNKSSTLVSPPQFAYGCFFNMRKEGKNLFLEVRSEAEVSLKSCEVLVQTQRKLSYNLNLDKNSEGLIDVNSEKITLNVRGIFEHKKNTQFLEGSSDEATLKFSTIEEGSFTQSGGQSQFNFRSLKEPFTLTLRKGKTYLDIDPVMIVDPKKKAPVVEKKGFFTKKEKVPLLKIFNFKGQVSLIQNTGKS